MNIDWQPPDFCSFRAKNKFKLRIAYLICNGSGIIIMKQLHLKKYD